RGGKEVQAHPAPRERAAERRVAEVKRRRVRAEDQADAEVPRQEREQARREEAKAEADVAFEEARRRWKEADAEITSDPFSFWRRVVKGFPASDGKGGETEIPASEFAHEARRLFQTCGAMGEEGGERDEGGWRRAAAEMARKGGRPPPPRVPFRMEPYTFREVRRSARARKQTTKPGWDGLVGAWWMLPALTRAAVAVVDWTRKARKPGVGMSWVEARFIQKNGKEVEEYKRNLKAWRVIGKPLTLTKVVEGARMRRRTDFFRENGYVDPTDPQKGNKGGLAGCVAHCAGLSEELAGMAAEARKGEVAFLDLRDAYSSAPHALLQVAEEWWHLPREETEFWKEADAAGTARVLVGKEEVWAGPVTVGVVAGGTASPDRFCLALEVVMRASDARVASERVILKDPRTGEKKERSSRKGLMDDTTLLVATVEAMQRELVKVAGDFKSVNLLVHPGKCVTGSIKRGHL
ncbi:MAG: hypothetical protein VX317_05555, partial [Verrucomicrobiota bacterium]|nr:hypothetical protein [Verrucomicrobiota bacterium]